MWDGKQIRTRLKAARRADRGLAHGGADWHRYRLGRPLSEKRVLAFEAAQGITLPADYRSFLLSVGDGGAGPYFGLFPLSGAGIHQLDQDRPFRPDHLATPFPHVEHWNPRAEPPYDQLSDDEYGDERWETGSMIISEMGCAVYFRLVVTGPARGQVWCDDRASDNGMGPEGHFRAWYEDWLDELPS